MRGFNKAIVMGNLARDPEVRYTATNQAVARITVAVSRKWKGEHGEVQEQVDFIPVVVWGALAGLAEKYLAKGAGVLVEGRLSVRSYEKDGQKRYATEVVAQTLQFVGGRREDAGGEDHPSAARASRSGSLENPPLDVSGEGVELAAIPF